MNTILIKNKENFPNMESHNKSPFAIFSQTEELVKTEYEPINHTLQLREIDELIIVLTNKFLIVTSIMLENILNDRFGVQTEKKEIQVRVKQLAHYEYLNSYRFKDFTNGTQSANKIYTVGWRGVGFLKAKGVKPNLVGYINNNLNNVQAKKILSVNQYLIKSEFRLDDFCVAEIVRNNNFKDGESDTIFRPHAIINTDTDTIIVESVRKNDGYLEEISKKITRICKTIKKNCESVKHPDNITLMLIGEDSSHIEFVVKYLNSIHPFMLLNFKIAFTSDLQIYKSQHEEFVYEYRPSMLQNLFCSI